MKDLEFRHRLTVVVSCILIVSGSICIGAWCKSMLPALAYASFLLLVHNGLWMLTEAVVNIRFPKSNKPPVDPGEEWKQDGYEPFSD